MKENVQLFQRGSWSLEKSTKAAPELVDLLANTIWGTPGKTLYQHLDTRQRVLQLQGAHYLNLRRAGKLTAGLTLCQRRTQDASGHSNAFYIRYLSMAEALRVKRPNALSAGPDAALMIRPGSFLKNALYELFQEPDRLADPLQDTANTFLYAYVESENRRSRQICNAFGFERIRSFTTLPFSRFFPKRHQQVNKAQAGDQAEILEHVEAQYQGYNLLFTDHLFPGDHYYVFKKAEKIVAGVRAMPVHWVINNLPGISGKLTLHLVPYLPLISRLFNPGGFRFAAFEGLFFLPGHEQELFALLEGVLAELQLHTALFSLDNESDLFQFLLSSGQLGLLHHLHAASAVDVLVRFAADPAANLAAYRKAPAYISALDLS